MPNTRFEWRCFISLPVFTLWYHLLSMQLLAVLKFARTSTILQSQKELSKAKQSRIRSSCFVLLFITPNHSLRNARYAKIKCFRISCVVQVFCGFVFFFWGGGGCLVCFGFVGDFLVGFVLWLEKVYQNPNQSPSQVSQPTPSFTLKLGGKLNMALNIIFLFLNLIIYIILLTR